MRIAGLILFTFLLSFQGLAQTDLPEQKPLKIEAANKLDKKGETNKGSVLNIPSVIDDKPKINFKDSLTRNPVKMLPDTELVQAGFGLKIDPKIRQEEGSEEYFDDTYLGDVETTSKYIGILFRDHGEVDGDQIKVLLNDQIINKKVFLSGSFYAINLELNQGLNRIEFKGVHEGSSPPITSQLMVYDANEQIIYNNNWWISKGATATIILVRKDY